MAESPARADEVAVLAPSGQDGGLAERVLGRWGVRAVAYPSMDALCEAVGRGVGAVIVAEEALRSAARERLIETLAAQPSWSDVPTIVLTSEGELSRGIAGGVGAVAARGNVTLLERPVRVATLVTALRSALRARERQYDVRDALTERLASEARLRESEERLRTMADSIPQLAWMAESDGSVFWYNRRWYEYTGTAPAEVAGWGWQRVYDPATLPDVTARWRASLASGEPFETESALRGADGTYRWFLTRVLPVHDGDGAVARWFGTSTDVQALREAREAQEAARAEAEAANRSKSEFLAMMSHELRTPLNAIGGYAELIELGLHGPVTPQQRDALRRMQKSQRHLLGLINGVLNYARVESGTVHYDVADVPMDEVLATCEALVAPQVRARGLRLTYDAGDRDVVVLGDREKVQQVVLNLLTNAVKFTEPGGDVRMTCEARGDVVAVRVADTGLGIPADKLRLVFEPFVQVDSRLTRTKEGVGLGLAISRDLARGMGGELTAESTAGVGSTFTLTLPRSMPADADPSLRSG